MKRQIILIAHNLRSCHNVGSLLRTVDGLGVDRVFLTGYTPYPLERADERLPHLAAKINKQIQKTALGADQSVAWQHSPDVFKVIRSLQADGFSVVALEQSGETIELPGWKVPVHAALVVGSETDGLETGILEACDAIVAIPMFGKKESFNVVQAAAMALYHCRFRI
ncbi:MAG TPA: TrmH family RNA methyltransferase [Candidatus Saccharimonadales bacterium]|nr:TrmH family RNA methyltransferase [Candidatus Saccharimonadales bacterium]